MEEHEALPALADGEARHIGEYAQAAHLPRPGGRDNQVRRDHWEIPMDVALLGVVTSLRDMVPLGDLVGERLRANHIEQKTNMLNRQFVEVTDKFAKLALLAWLSHPGPGSTQSGFGPCANV